MRREENQSVSLDMYGSGREDPAKRTNQRGGSPGSPVLQKPQEEGFKDVMQDEADRASGERTIKYPLNLLYVNSYLQLPLTFVNRHKGKGGC